VEAAAKPPSPAAGVGRLGKGGPATSTKIRSMVSPEGLPVAQRSAGTTARS